MLCIELLCTPADHLQHLVVIARCCHEIADPIALAYTLIAGLVPFMPVVDNIVPACCRRWRFPMEDICGQDSGRP